MWLPHVTVAAVLEKDGKFLFVEERSEERLVINQPAGHWDEGETLVAAAAREVLEETGWEFTPTRLIGIYNWKQVKNGVTYLRFAFTGTLDRQRSEKPLDSAILRTLWLTPTELAACRERHRSPLILRCMEDYQEGKRYPLSILNDIG